MISRNICSEFTCNRTHNDDPPIGIIFFMLNIFHQHISQEEVPQMVCTHAQLEAIRGVPRFLRSRQIHCGITHKDIQGTPGLANIVNELLDTVEGGQITMDDGVAILGHAHSSRSTFGFEEVTACHYNVPFARIGKNLSGGKTET